MGPGEQIEVVGHRLDTPQGIKPFRTAFFDPYRGATYRLGPYRVYDGRREGRVGGGGYRGAEALLAGRFLGRDEPADGRDKLLDVVLPPAVADR